MGYIPRGLYFDDFEVGQEFETASRTITEADIVNFAGLSGDFNPLHTNEEFAKNTPFKTRIAHGVLSLAVATGLANQLGIFEGTTVALMEMVARYTGAVLPGDTIRLVLKVAEKKEIKKPDRGVMTVETRVLNQDDRPVLEGHWLLMMARRPS